MAESCSRTEVRLKLEPPGGAGARILLHCCCAPCSGAIIETMVSQGLRPTVFWSNSNIYLQEEYDKRKAEIIRYCALFGLDFVDDDYDHDDWLKEVAAGREDAPERGERCLACFRYRLLRAARYAVENGFGVLTTSLASSRWKSLEQVDAAGRDACEAVARGSGCPREEVLPDHQATEVNGRSPRGSGCPREEVLPDHQAAELDGQGPRGSGCPREEVLPDHQAPAWWSMNWRKGGLQPRRSEIIREQNFYNQSFCGCEFSL